MTPSHSNCHGRRYRYYLSQAIKKYKKSQAGTVSKIPAGEIEKFVIENVKDFLQNRKEIQKSIKQEFEKRLEYAYARIKEIPFLDVKRPEGSIYMFIDIRKTN